MFPDSCLPLRYVSPNYPNGPTLVLTCLNHGDEVIGLSTALEVLELVKTWDNFCGQLVIFPCLNQMGFWRGSRLFEAQNFDGATTPNLNRSWPGNGNSLAGLTAEKFFKAITAEKPDLVLDLHSYAANSLIHVIVDRPSGNMEQSLIDLCQKAQLPFYLEYESQTLEEQMLDKSLSNQLCLHQVPSLTVELGPKGSFDQTQAHLALQAVVNLLFASGNLKTNTSSSTAKNTNQNLVNPTFSKTTEDQTSPENAKPSKIATASNLVSSFTAKLTANFTSSAQNLTNLLNRQDNPITVKNSIQDLFSLQKTTIDTTQTYFREGLYAGLDSYGFFRFIAPIGQLVPKDTMVAQVWSLSGELVENIVMPSDGFVIAVDDVAVVYPRRQLAVFIKVLEADNKK